MGARELGGRRHAFAGSSAVRAPASAVVRAPGDGRSNRPLRAGMGVLACARPTGRIAQQQSTRIKQSGGRGCDSRCALPRAPSSVQSSSLPGCRSLVQLQGGAPCPGLASRRDGGASVAARGGPAGSKQPGRGGSIPSPRAQARAVANNRRLPIRLGETGALASPEVPPPLVSLRSVHRDGLPGQRLKWRIPECVNPWTSSS